MATALAPARVEYPPLESGDEMTSAEFERRYDADPVVHHAELIDGVVYVSSPVRAEYHGKQFIDVAYWLRTFTLERPGLAVYADSTLRIDDSSQLQPDLALCIDDGASRIDEEGYLTGAPELVVEVAASTFSRDMHRKKGLYAEIGVREYVVWRVYDEAIDWFVLEKGTFVARKPGKDGIVSSKHLSGLRLDVAAMLKGDMKAVVAALGATAPRKH